LRQKLFISTVVALAALAGSSPAWAAGSKTFTDPTGDASQGPDITQLVVSNDDNGQITFQFTFSNRPTILTGEDVVLMGLDTDANGGTGDAAGYEYYLGFGYLGRQLYLAKTTGANTSDENVPKTTLRFADGGRTLSINRSELGNTSSFRMRVVTSVGGGQIDDTAPEGGGTWDYQLVLAPQIVAIRAGFVPAQPRQGKAFALASPTLRLSSGQMVPPEAYSCRATLGGKALKTAGRCRWNVPKKSKGKRLVVTVTATYGGVTASFDPYVFTVRA
jgi:hypothetical protein